MDAKKKDGRIVWRAPYTYKELTGALGILTGIPKSIIIYRGSRLKSSHGPKRFPKAVTASGKKKGLIAQEEKKRILAGALRVVLRNPVRVEVRRVP